MLLLCEFIFTVDGQDYIDDALFLLNAFLFKIQNISPRVWFFYQVVVYNIVGIPKEMWSIIDKLPVGEKDKKIFLAIKEGNNL